MPNPHVEPIEQTHRPHGTLRMRPRSAGNYVQTCNHVYAEADGVGLVMDVFQPDGPTNGRAIVDVISGAWRSDRPRLNEHIGMGVIDALCAAGYTVFAVAPGSATLFTAHQMVGHIHAAIRHIRDHEERWNIDGSPLGLCGVSAGGHLAALTALGPQAPVAKAKQSWFRQNTSVDAVGLFFPPSDLLDYGGAHFDFAREGEFAVPRLLFPDGLAGHSDGEIETAAEAISPRHLVGTDHPPLWIAHATGDAVVPYSQSAQFVETLEAAGNDVTFVTHEGPGHLWPTVTGACEDLAHWFDQHLLP